MGVWTGLLITKWLSNQTTTRRLLQLKFIRNVFFFFFSFLCQGSFYVLGLLCAFLTPGGSIPQSVTLRTGQIHRGGYWGAVRGKVAGGTGGSHWQSPGPAAGLTAVQGKRSSRGCWEAGLSLSGERVGPWPNWWGGSCRSSSLQWTMLIPPWNQLGSSYWAPVEAGLSLGGIKYLAINMLSSFH